MMKALLLPTDILPLLLLDTKFPWYYVILKVPDAQRGERRSDSYISPSTTVGSLTLTSLLSRESLGTRLSLVPRPCVFVACSMKFAQNFVLQAKCARPGNEAK